MSVTERIAVLGDLHGHLQLALCMLARWQKELGKSFDAVLLCGDVGTFADGSELDSATRQHARTNPCELEFLEQWAPAPPAPWLQHIFLPPPHGLGLTCPVVMVHGNHEGFSHLERLVPSRIPADPVSLDELPPVDSAGFIRLLPSGWRVRTARGRIVAGVGGIEQGQRKAKYHPMAYIDDHAVERLLDSPPVDVLVTHQGPGSVQGDALGSPTLDVLLEARVARFWLHGHATPNSDITLVGRCRVVPLGDIAFAGRGKQAGDPGLEGWSWIDFTADSATVARETPPFWREYRLHRWTRARDGRLICPDLMPFVHGNV